MVQEAKPPVKIAIVGLAHDHAYGFIPRMRGRPNCNWPASSSRTRTWWRVTPRLQPADRSVQPEPRRAAGPNEHAGRRHFHQHARAPAGRGNVRAPAHRCDDGEAAGSQHGGRAGHGRRRPRNGGIHVMVNYETTWYPGNQTAYKLVHEEHAIGDLRKIVVHDGHRGPKEIGCSETFLKWLTDPVLNGGGALHGFRLLRRRSDHLADGRPAAHLRFRGDPADQARHLPQGGGRGDHRADLPQMPRGSSRLPGIGPSTARTWRFMARLATCWCRKGICCASARPGARRANSSSWSRRCRPFNGRNRLPRRRGPRRNPACRAIFPQVNLAVTEILDAARLSAQSGKRVELPSDRPW